MPQKLSGAEHYARLRDLEQLYATGAWTDQELAAKLGVHRSQIHRDRQQLIDSGVMIVSDEPGRYRLDQLKTQARLRLSREEALALYLPARRAARQTYSAQPAVVAALGKLSQVLAQPMTERLVESARQVFHQDANPERARIVETVTRGWIERIAVELTYRGLAAQESRKIEMRIYLIEPAVWGDGIYLIGPSDLIKGRIAALKLDRVEAARLTTVRFDLPADLDEGALLADAWGVWLGREKPERVVLKFKPGAVSRRVQETIWHPTEKRDPQPDGLLWTAEISEIQEMVPWIRGWGADVEVLEPTWLRKELGREVKEMARIYGLGERQPFDALIAHRRKGDEAEQSLTTHLIETSQLAERFAAKAGLPDIGKVMGLLHDFGKASTEYQNYLRSAEGMINPDEDDYVDYKAKKGKIDHSTAGAQLVYQKLASKGTNGKFLAQFLALAMASHHSGLIDCLKPDGKNEFERRMTKGDADTHLTEARTKLPYIEKQLDEILTRPIEEDFYRIAYREMTDLADSKDVRWFKRGLLARFLLSCLLDADRLNTADFESPANESLRNYGNYTSWEVLIERLEEKFAEFAQETAQMQPGRALDVNRLRAYVAQACLDAAPRPQGIFQLTVPTGGGKTLASLRFALHHARAHNVDRVFYIVPYTTIIDQNAKDVRRVLRDTDERGNPSDKIVLEHHSNFVPPSDTRRRHNLLAEDWDAPIVFTTQVQFLEALFGSGTRDARRMHQLANSIIILDEVQTIPIRITHMFTAALRFLVHSCGASAVLCTATQPPFDNLDNPYRELKISHEQHIIQDEAELFKRLKRVEVHDERKPAGWTNAEITGLAEHALREKGSVLIVVNTRALAQAVYRLIKAQNGEAKVYHLSTNMCPTHREDVLNEIRDLLKTNEPVICVSTQLIEAGVDIDFGAVIRAVAGLDSIAQSAGRCNRHGVREGLGSVWVVNPQDENLDRLSDIKIGRGHAQRVLDDFNHHAEQFGHDRIGLSAVSAYYDFYYGSRKSELDFPVSAHSSVGRSDNLFDLLAMNPLSVKAYEAHHQSAPDILLRQSFRSAAAEFRVIDSSTRGVIVPYRDGDEVIKDLCGAFGLERQGRLLRQAQRYSVGLFSYQFDKLSRAGAIQEVQDGAGIYYLDKQHYSLEFGWSDEPVNGMDALIIGGKS